MKTVFLSTAILLISLPLQAQWYPVPSGTNENILDLYFSDSLTGYGISAHAVIKTTDAGENWTVIVQDTSLFLTSVVAGIDSVFCFGREDEPGGSAYKISFPSSSASYIKTVMPFHPVDPLYINGDLWYIESTDLNRYNNTAVTTLLSGVERFFIKNGHLSAATATKIYFSSDHGSSWENRQFTSSVLSSGPYQSYFDGSDTLLAVIQYPARLHYSYDKGNTWNNYTTPDIYYYFIDSRNLLGLQAFSPGNIVYSSGNGGQSFHTDTLAHLVDKCYIHVNGTAFLYGDNGIIYKTVNAGDPLGENKGDLKKKINVYPNPATSTLTIELPENVKVYHLSLTDMQGRPVKSHTAPGQRPIVMSGLKSGQFILRLQTDQGTATRKIIME